MEEEWVRCLSAISNDKIEPLKSFKLIKISKLKMIQGKDVE